METGNKVIVRSNEDIPLMTGVVTRFFDMDGKWSDKTPVVKSDIDGEEYVCMGLVLPFNTELVELLQTMTPKEQWDYIIDKFPRH